MSYGKTLDALADDTRRAILDLLREGPRSVGEMAQALPVSQPAVSQHLRILRGAGLVRVERAGTRRIYHIEPRGFDPLRAYVESYWDGPLRAFRISSRKSQASGEQNRAPIKKGR